jgi:predicted ATPase with chaperone activity
MKMIKIAQTIADLDGSDTVSKNYIAEALQYRPVSED